MTQGKVTTNRHTRASTPLCHSEWSPSLRHPERSPSWCHSERSLPCVIQSGVCGAKNPGLCVTERGVRLAENHDLRAHSERSPSLCHSERSLRSEESRKQCAQNIGHQGARAFSGP